MRLLLIVLLGFVLIAPPSAHALTLEITSGSADGISIFFPCPEPGVNVSGADFTLTGFSGTTFCGTTMQFVGTLTLDGVTYPGTCVPNCIDNTTFIFTNAPFTEPAPLDIPHYHGPYSTTFTMTGHTALNGGVDFVGAGTFTIGLIFTDSNTSLFEQWDFSVPEPLSLALLAFACAILAAAVKAKRTRARVTAA